LTCPTTIISGRDEERGMSREEIDFLTPHSLFLLQRAGAFDA
jgi:hypothetical protein